jgi:hypothetical protein
MKKQRRYPDSWCKSLRLPDGRTISGSAARDRRISQLGGMDTILKEAAFVGATMALNHFATQLGIRGH